MVPARYRERLERAALNPQFHVNEEFTLLSCDADSIIYKVAATTNNIETAKKRFVERAMTLQYLADAGTVSLHLTPKHCTKAGRFNVLATKEYQGQRKSGNKPELVEPLRYAVGRQKLWLPDEFAIVFNDVYEADDSVIMEGESFGDNCIIFSEDKDLLCTRRRMLCPVERVVIPGVPLNSVGTLEMKELSRSKKVVGRGPLFFWAQMLMGDTADNIAGLTKYLGKAVGPVSTWDLLSPMSGTNTTEAAVAHFVLSCYMENGQNPWPEGWLLWLYPKVGYNFFQHVKALGLLGTGDALAHWLKVQFNLKWFVNKED